MTHSPPSGHSHWDPSTYLEMIRSEVPGYDALQEAAIAAVPFPPARVLDLGTGPGETSRRLLEAYPDAQVMGLDSSPEMLFRAREVGIETRLARMEDPLPDGPWDLVIAVLSVHHLEREGKQDLLRRVREQSRSLVIGDVVAAEQQITPIKAGFDFPEDSSVLAEWAGGRVTWQAGDLAVVAASYR